MRGGEVERTDDGRWIVVDGRRWRASDPGVPEAFHQELVDELMDARRGVGTARRSGDADAEGRARRRVSHAKVALGERGHPWWEPPTDSSRRDRIEAALLALASRRGPDRTICPSDAARAVGGSGWRTEMDLVREVACALARDGRVELLQRGAVVPADGPIRGPLRIRATPG